MAEPSEKSGLEKAKTKFEKQKPIELWSGAAIPTGYSDVTNQVDRRGVELLNADDTKGTAAVLFEPSAPSSLPNANKGKEKEGEGNEAGELKGSGADWIESDTDEQLMLYIPFQSTLKAHTIQITSLAPHSASAGGDGGDDNNDEVPMRPKTFKLYTNRPQNLGFEEAEDTPPTQVIALDAKDWDAETNTAKLELRFVKFQNIVSLILFVVDGDGEGEKVRIDRLRIIGESGAPRNMQKLEKISDT